MLVGDFVEEVSEDPRCGIVKHVAGDIAFLEVDSPDCWSSYDEATTGANWIVVSRF